jgi:phenylpropionate dioxygenase-like ring-hydroxylating dioxygenase large terminal subunit
MSFLYNAWYCVTWASQVSRDEMMGRTLLNEPVLLYRKENGEAVAIGNRCPHRFAPLHLGKLKGDAVQCPYHGLTFNESGACVHNPHGDGALPEAAKVKSYRLVERDGILWIWMGDQGKADESLIPDFSTLLDPAFAKSEDYLNIGANYQLMTDNLLDLSHVPFLHPFLSPQGPPPPGFEAKFDLKQEDNTVYAFTTLINVPVSPLFQILWQENVEVGEMRSHMRWNPPSNLWLDNGITYVGRPTSEGPAFPSAHLLTPETETSTHYHWAAARDRKIDDIELGKELAAGVRQAFEHEDEPIIEACQRMMGTTDLMSLKPVILPGDGAAIRARRILAKLIAAEQEAAPRVA